MSSKKFTPRSTQPKLNNEYYNYGPFYANGYGWAANNGNCTAYSFGRFHEIMGKKSDKQGYSVGTGNGGEWFAQATGYSKGQKPAVGAICCWKHGGAGHVAIIEEIGKNYIILSESGYANGLFWTSAWPYSGNNNWYKPGQGYVLQGYIYNPALNGVTEFGKVANITYNNGANVGSRSGVVVGSFTGDNSVSSNTSTTDDGSINLQDSIAQLYTSDNYKWLAAKEKDTKESTTNALLKTVEANIKNKIETIKDEGFGSKINSFVEELDIETITRAKKVEKTLVKGNLASYPNLIQAPYIDLELNGIRIGGYNNAADKYPNHLTSLSVDKINGRINNYTINLVHQVRAGDDPNVIDTLLSRTGYRNKVRIRYGDSAFGSYFRDEDAYIIDVSHTDNYASATINYTIKAVSSVDSIQQAYFDFPGITSKPSTEILKMLYDNKETSTQLLGLLEGMRNKTEALGRGLIPTDDDEIYIPGLKDASLLDRLTQLVSYMYDSSAPGSSYFLSFGDAVANEAFFKITKVTKTSVSSDSLKNCYYLDIGYPGNAFVTSFNIENDVYFPMYYKYADSIPNYNYDIDYSGNLITKKVNPLLLSDKYQAIDTRQMNWWNFVKTYPISATVTIKGLMKPTMLMENVYVYAQFYGEEDMATGLYSIINQHDEINGRGYFTTLELLRIS